MTTTTDRPLYRDLDEPPYVVADLDRQLRAIQDVETIDRLIENEKAKQNRKTVIDRAEARRRAVGGDPAGAGEPTPDDERSAARVETAPVTHPKEEPMTVAVEKDDSGRAVAVDADTGEILGEIEDAPTRAVQKYRPAAPASMSTFLSEIVSDEALEEQSKLSEAYDRFCRALLSANDVQKADGKEFKKKSAWRKLGRAFQVSTEITRRASHWEDDDTLPDGYRHFVAEYEVRASFPWGQHTEGAGACSTRESRFWISGVVCPECGGPTWDNRPRKGEPDWKTKARAEGRLPAFGCKDKACGGAVDLDEIEAGPEGIKRLVERRPNPTLWGKAEHDVRGTAETRATNRAISNLIAAGEVSAEEVDGGGGDNHPVPANGMESEPEGQRSPPSKPKKSAEPMSQPQYDEIAGLLDSRDFEGQDKRREWCEGVVRGEITPSYDMAAKAIEDLTQMALRGEEGADDSSDELPF